VKEYGAIEQRERLTEAYVGLAAQGESAIVVSQTRAEVREINEAVRERLRERGVLTGAETSVIALEQIDLTAAQKADARHYPAENCIVFNREFRGCARGAKGSLVVRGATRRERSLFGVVFAIGAFAIVAWFVQGWGIIHGSSLLPRPDSNEALFVFLSIIALLLAGYILGSSIARLFRRSQVRFFRSYRNQ